MTTTKLLTPLLDQGVRHTHFFHGRLLSADALRDEQEAQHRHLGQLGRAAGAGVVEGLEVAIDQDGSDGRTPVLSVTPGLAFNRKGQALELVQGERVALTREVEPVAPEAGLFTDCRPPDTGLLGVGDGLFLLVLAPVSGFRQRAPKSGLGGDGAITGCGSRYRVEGVSFRLERLDLAQRPELAGLFGATVNDRARLSKLRNVVAHLCFGTEELKSFAVDPFERTADGSTHLSYGVLDEARQLGALDDCDVPLALFYWTLEGIQYLDLWSVRRRPISPPPSADWPLLGGARRRAEAEAVLFQFQQHLDDLLRPSAGGDPTAIEARDYFRYLPPVGLLPIQADGRPRGLDYATFFAQLPHREPVLFNAGQRLRSLFTEGSRIRSLIAHSLTYPAIDARGEEFLWLYQVRENHQSSFADAAIAERPYMIFASGFMPFFGDSRFDLSRWDFSNYGHI